MSKIWILAGIYILGCSTNPSAKMPVDKPSESPFSDSNLQSPFRQGLMNEYDIWEFLKGYPTEQEVLITIGSPDSIWVDEEEEIRILYYFIKELEDFNSIEIRLPDGVVTGFEWD